MRNTLFASSCTLALAIPLALLSSTLAARASAQDEALAPVPDAPATSSEPAPLDETESADVSTEPSEPIERAEPSDEPSAFDEAHRADRDHFEFTMGFLAGERRYSDLSFSTSSAVPGAAALVEPFGDAPFDGSVVLGLRWELRVVASHVRMIAGFDLPFVRTASGAPTTYRVLDQDRSVSVRSLQPWEIRFGIGGEYAIDRLVPFVDLIGAVYGADTTLAIDSQSAAYEAIGFGFVVRPGARVMVNEWFFVQASAEIGVVGPAVWNAELSVGFWVG